MYKKILTILLVGFSLLKAFEVPLNSNNIIMDLPEGETYFFTPLVDISYTQLQDAIKNDTNDSAVIYVYRWYQQPEIIEGIFGVSILGAIKITKNKIGYYLVKKEGGNYHATEYSSSAALVEAINEYKELADKNEDEFYKYPNVEAFSKLKKYEQYFIKPVGIDLTITFTLPNSGCSGSGNDDVNESNDGSSPDSGNNGLIYPPTPPANVIGD